MTEHQTSKVLQTKKLEIKFNKKPTKKVSPKKPDAEPSSSPIDPTGTPSSEPNAVPQTNPVVSPARRSPRKHNTPETCAQTTKKKRKNQQIDGAQRTPNTTTKSASARVYSKRKKNVKRKLVADVCDPITEKVNEEDNVDDRKNKKMKNVKEGNVADAQSTKSKKAEVSQKNSANEELLLPCPDVLLRNPDDTLEDMQDDVSISRSQRFKKHNQALVDEFDEEEDHYFEEDVESGGRENGESEKEMENVNVEKEMENDVEKEMENNHAVEVEEVPKKKRKFVPRGPTQMLALGINKSNYRTEINTENQDKFPVHFNTKKQPVGNPSVLLASMLGVLVRRTLTLNTGDWRRVSDESKERIWKMATNRFIVGEEYKPYYVAKMGIYLKEARSRAATAVIIATDTLEGEERKKELARLRPGSMTVAEWEEFIAKKTSAKHRAKRLEMQEHRKKHTTPHTISRQGYARLEKVMQKKKKTKEEIPRVDLWKAGHVQRSDRDPNPGVVEAFKRIEEEEAKCGGSSGSSLTDDVIAKAIGKDKPGRKIKGIGFGPSMKNLETNSYYKNILVDLVQRLESLEEKNAKCVCQDVQHSHRSSPDYSGSASNNRASTSRTVCWNEDATRAEKGKGVQAAIALERSNLSPIALERNSLSPTSLPRVTEVLQEPKRGQECKLLSWYTEEGVVADGDVVAEATIFETDPAKKLHNVPLGMNNYSVNVVLSLLAGVHLPRPTGGADFVHEAESSFVAWPKDKILLV